MALAKSRGVFTPGGQRLLAAMSPGIRREIASGAARFFGLPEKEARVLESLSGCEEWARHIHASITTKGRWSFTFFTSGSTGRPCPHTYGFAEMEEEALALRLFFPDRRRVVSVMPIHHVFGFAFALMLPKYLDIPVKDMPPLPSAEFFRELREGDLVLAFPVFWRSFLDMCSGPRAVFCPPQVRGVTSGAPCPPETIEGLLALLPQKGRAILDGMTEIYGATEFGAVGLRRQCRGLYTLLPHWERVLLDNGEWGIRRQSGSATPLPDIVSWEGGRSFVPLGRKDNAVQVGGVNVFPARVADLLRGHPKVRDCAVRLMRPEEGTRLKAFVVPEEGAPPEFALARELKRWLTERLEPAARPKSVSLGSSLPVTFSGKLADWDIAGQPKADES
jgi:4-coumarate--CoA ligase (photoactive yellow protein activation family)